MKKFKILLIIVALYLILGTVIFQVDRVKIKNQKIELQQKQDSIDFYKEKYKEVTKLFREHLKECSFISKASIQRISRNGRYITLYSPTNTERK
jgi:hypothetical protein